MIEPRLFDALHHQGAFEPAAEPAAPEALPGFRPDGTPWTDEDIQALWAGLRAEASRWPALRDSVGGEPPPTAG